MTLNGDGLGWVVINLMKRGVIVAFIRGCLDEKTRTGASFIPG